MMLSITLKNDMLAVTNKPILLSIIILSNVMLSVILLIALMLSVAMLSVIILINIMLSVVMLNVVAPQIILTSLP
jgi:polyferredoxin